MKALKSSQRARPRYPKGQGHRTREEILHSTLLAVERFGLEGTTIRVIAADCGVSSAALYSHFANKAQLLAALFEVLLRQLAGRLEDTARCATDPRTRLRAMLGIISGFILDHAELCRHAAGRSAGDDLAGQNRAVAQCLAALRRAIARTPRFRREGRREAAVAARAIWTCLHGQVLLARGQSWSHPSDQQCRAMIVDLLHDALQRPRDPLGPAGHTSRCPRNA